MEGSGRDLLAEDMYAVGLVLMEMLLLVDDDDGSQTASISGLLGNCYRAMDGGTVTGDGDGGPLETAALLSAQFDALRRLPMDDSSTAPAAFIALALRCCDPCSTRHRPSAAECVEECDLMLIDIGLQLDEWHYPHYQSFTPIAHDGASMPPLFVRATAQQLEEPSSSSSSCIMPTMEMQCPHLEDKVFEGTQLGGRISAADDAADADDDDAADAAVVWEEGLSFEQQQHQGSSSGMSVEEDREDVALSLSNAPSWESSSSTRPFDLLTPSK